jgi:tetratricopeptide (TPR) repeat protein
MKIRINRITVLHRITALVLIMLLMNTDARITAADEKGSQDTQDSVESGESSGSVHTTSSTNRWIKKSSPRSWTATAQKPGTPTIEFLNGKGPVKAASGSSANKAMQASATQSPNEASRPPANFTQMNSSPAPAADPKRPLTATERFKRALAEQRRALTAESVDVAEKKNSLNGSNSESALDDVSADNSSRGISADALLGLTASESADLESEDPLRREMAERFLRLKMKILELKSRNNAAPNPATQAEQLEPPATERTQTSPDAEAFEPADPVTNELPSEDPESMDPSPESPAETSDDSSPHENSGDDPLNSETVPDSTNNDPASGDMEAESSQQPVISGPIDRMGLANNLYAVGEYLMAMELYKETDESPLTAQQQIWAEYQTANCLRRLGQTGEASNRYRRLAGQPEAGWLSEKAGWWVGVLEQIRQLEKSLEDAPATQATTEFTPVSGPGLTIPAGAKEAVQP